MSLTAHLTDGFFSKLKIIAARRNFYPEHALNFMMHESGVKPDIWKGHYGGLFMKYHSTSEGAQAFAQQSAEEQLDAFDAFMAPYTSLEKTRPEHLYQLIFLPATAIPGQANYRGNEPGSVLAAQGGTGFGGREDQFYRDNPSLDVDKDGRITVSDLGQLLENYRSTPYYAELIARLGAAPGEWSPAPALSKLPLGPIAFVLGVLAVAYVGHATGALRLPLPRRIFV